MGLSQTIAAKEVHSAIARLAAAIADGHRGAGALWLLGIANGGITLAHRLAAEINRLPSPRPAAGAVRRHPPGRSAGKKAGSRPMARAGTLDISFHRDDFGRHPVPKEFTPTDLPGDVTGAAIVLVDDVIFTGRTIKASLDELFDHGRPARVGLAVLVDRGGRRLPIAPDHVGLKLDARNGEIVDVDLGEDPARDRITVRPG